MAINTKSKRFSMMGVGMPFVKHPMPAGSLNKANRATLMDLYNGIALRTPLASFGAYLLTKLVSKSGAVVSTNVSKAGIYSSIKRASFKTDVT